MEKVKLLHWVCIRIGILYKSCFEQLKKMEDNDNSGSFCVYLVTAHFC